MYVRKAASSITIFFMTVYMQSIQLIKATVSKVLVLLSKKKLHIYIDESPIYQALGVAACVRDLNTVSEMYLLNMQHKYVFL